MFTSPGTVKEILKLIQKSWPLIPFCLFVSFCTRKPETIVQVWPNFVFYFTNTECLWFVPCITSVANISLLVAVCNCWVETQLKWELMVSGQCTMMIEKAYREYEIRMLIRPIKFNKYYHSWHMLTIFFLQFINCTKKMLKLVPKLCIFVTHTKINSIFWLKYPHQSNTPVNNFLFNFVLKLTEKNIPRVFLHLSTWNIEKENNNLWYYK